MAVLWGTAVMGSFSAMGMPMAAPTASARMSSPGRWGGYAMRVATMASAMPAAPAQLPRRDVLTSLIHFRDRMNRTAAAL